MKVIDFINNVSFHREDNEVRDVKDYCVTLALGGLFLGMVAGIVAVILQFVISNRESQELWANIFASVFAGAGFSYMVYLLLPMLQDSKIPTGTKVTTTLLSLVCLAGPFILGIYVIVLVVMAAIALGVLYIVAKVSGSTFSSSSSGDDDAESITGPEGGRLYGSFMDESHFVSSGEHYKRVGGQWVKDD